MFAPGLTDLSSFLWLLLQRVRLDAEFDRCVGLDELLLDVDVELRVRGVDEGDPDLDHALLLVELPLLDHAHELPVHDPLAELEGVRRRPVTVGGDYVWGWGGEEEDLFRFTALDSKWRISPSP